MGYHFASENASKLVEHNLLSGNRLTIIAFGNGIAFAEGIAAFLFEEKRTKVYLAIYIYGNAVDKVPQLEEAVNFRIVLGKTGKATPLKRFNTLMFKNIYVEEKRLPARFYKFSVYAYVKNDKYPIGFFIQKDKGVRSLLRRNKEASPALFWGIISHSISLLETADTILDYGYSSHANSRSIFNLSYN